jgi:hypothetical protein
MKWIIFAIMLITTLLIGCTGSTGPTGPSQSPTPLITIDSTLLTFNDVIINTESSVKFYILSAVNLLPANDALTITAPLGFTISTKNDSDFTSSKRIPYTNGIISIKIYVKFIPTIIQNYFNCVITNSGGGAISQDVIVNGNGVAVPPPELIVTSPSFNIKFGNIYVNNISDTLSFAISGRYLIPQNENITINSPAGFQISTINYAGFSSSITLPYKNGKLSTKIIYVRFAPTAVYYYNASISISGGGILLAFIQVQGTGIVQSIITNISSLWFGNVIVDTVKQLSYTLSGLNLTPASGSIAITSPSGYQVSVTSGSGFGSSLNVSYTGSTLSSTTIYVRFSPTAVQSYTGNITNAGGGATTQNVAVTGNGIVFTIQQPISNIGLVAYYPFNGNANDESGNGNNGTNYGATLTTDRFGNANSAYSFNGINNYIVTPLGNNMQSLTISLWFKCKQKLNFPLSSNKFNIIGFSDDDNNVSDAIGAWDFVGNANNVKLNGVTYNGMCNWVNVMLSTLDTTWYHIVYMRNKNSISLYLNGILQGSISYTGNYQINTDLIIGKLWKIWDGNYFNGSIDDIRIYNRVLSETEVLALYNEQ